MEQVLPHLVEDGIKGSICCTNKEDFVLVVIVRYNLRISFIYRNLVLFKNS